MVTYNGLVSLRNSIENAWAQIDVQLKRRYDLIPNLVETVKGYASHERETLDAVDQGPQRRHERRRARTTRPRPRTRSPAPSVAVRPVARPTPTSRPTRTSASCRKS